MQRHISNEQMLQKLLEIVSFSFSTLKIKLLIIIFEVELHCLRGGLQCCSLPLFACTVFCNYIR